MYKGIFRRALRLPARRAEPEQAELVFVAPPAPLFRSQSYFCGSHNLWAEPFHLPERLIGLQHELPRELSRDPKHCGDANNSVSTTATHSVPQGKPTTKPTSKNRDHLLLGLGN